MQAVSFADIETAKPTYQKAEPSVDHTSDLEDNSWEKYFLKSHHILQDRN